MDIRTTENCQKYREAKQFVKEYENEYNSILHKKYDIDMLLWDERLHIMNCRNSLKDKPNLLNAQAAFCCSTSVFIACVFCACVLIFRIGIDYLT